MRFLLVASILGPLLLFAGTSWYNYREIFRIAERELVRASEVAREHAAKVFDSDRLVADQVIEMVRYLDEDAIVAAEEGLNRRLRNLIADVPQVQSVLLVGRSGDALASSGTYPIARQMNVGDRDYFAAIRDRGLAIYLSDVYFGRLSQASAFSLSRRRSDADGNFAGVVNIAVPPSYFAEFDKALLEPDGSSMTLLREDGQIIIRYPVVALPAPKIDSDNLFFAAAAQRPDGGVYRDASVVDGEPRLFAYQKVPGYPAYVVAGRPISAIMGSWYWLMATHLLFGVPATICLYWLSHTALTRTRREQDALRQAQEEMRKREAAEDALRQSQKLEAIGQLTGGVAHDFNNLLTAVLGNLELVEMRTTDDKLRRMVQIASRAAQRGAALTQQLLAFSRKQHLVPLPVDLNATVRSMCDMLGRTLGTSVEIATDLGRSLWPALVDPTQVELALINLTINGRDAMSGKGKVTIATRNLPAPEAAARPDLVPGDYVVVSVSDTGEGMSEEVLTRAFEPFYTTKGVGKGSGLGLSQVYGLARQSGGTVVIESRLGEGTCVQLILPRALALQQKAEPGLLADVFERRRGTLLVVDDEEDVRDVAVSQLTALGYGTRIAASGSEALEVLRENHIDLILIDYAMPGMDGIALLEAARMLKPGLPALLVTGYADPASLSGGIADLMLLKKPYRIHELSAKVDAALRLADGGSAVEAPPPAPEQAKASSQRS